MHLCSGERVRCTSHAPACEWATSWSCRSDLARSALQLALGRRPFVTVMRSVCSPCRTSEQPAAELANQNNACGPLLAANSCTLPCFVFAGRMNALLPSWPTRSGAGLRPPPAPGLSWKWTQPRRSRWVAAVHMQLWSVLFQCVSFPGGRRKRNAGAARF